MDGIAGLNRTPTRQTAKPEAPPSPDAPSDSQGQASTTHATAVQESAISGAQEPENANNDDAKQKSPNLFKLVLSGRSLSRRHEEKVFEERGVHPLLETEPEGLDRFYRRVDQDEAGKPLSTKQYYTSRGTKLSPQNEALSVDVMGERSSAIILRSSEAKKRKKASDKVASQQQDDANSKLGAPKARTPKAESTDTEILGTDETKSTSAQINVVLESEDQYPSTSSSLRNIHELRPKSSQPLLTNDFEELKRKLEEGFTASQLQKYAHSFHLYPPEPKVDEPQPQESQDTRTIQSPWLVKKHPWVPVIPSGPQESDIAELYHPDMSAKERLVLRVMRDCWGLSSHRTLEAQGRLDVEVADTEFDLLLVGTRQFLRDIANNFLESGNQIEAVVPRKIISILAQKTTAESIILEIDSILSHAKTIHIDANLVSSKPLDPELLEEAGRLTNTLVRLDPLSKKISVSWIDLPEPRKGVENLGDVVVRLLLNAFRPSPRTLSATSLSPASRSRTKAQNGGYIAKYDCQEQLPWYERHKEWARWVAPIDAKKKKRWEKIDQDSLLQPIEVKDWDHSVSRQPGDPFKSRGEPLDLGGWSELATGTTAVFGHILHAQPANPDSKITTKFKPSDRTFVPIVPPIKGLSLPSNLMEEGLWHYTVIMRFLPDPQRPSAPGTPPPPPLELRIEGDHKELKRIIEVRAVTSSLCHDILLPSAPVDVRLLQTRYFSLPGITIDEHLPVVLKFLNDSDLAPWLDVMATPPTLPGVRLPRRLLETDAPSQEVEKASSAAPTENTQDPQQTGCSEIQTEPADDFVTVDYLYAGFEVQRAVTAEYEGFKLTYSSTKGEKYVNNSRTAQISLGAVAVDKTLLGPDGKPLPDAVASPEADSSQPKLDAAAFLEVVSAMANKTVRQGDSRFGWEVRGIQM
jgi:hypothetical protein